MQIMHTALRWLLVALVRGQVRQLKAFLSTPLGTLAAAAFLLSVTGILGFFTFRPTSHAWIYRLNEVLGIGQASQVCAIVLTALMLVLLSMLLFFRGNMSMQQGYADILLSAPFQPHQVLRFHTLNKEGLLSFAFGLLAPLFFINKTPLGILLVFWYALAMIGLSCITILVSLLLLPTAPPAIRRTARGLVILITLTFALETLRLSLLSPWEGWHPFATALSGSAVLGAVSTPLLPFGHALCAESPAAQLIWLAVCASEVSLLLLVTFSLHFDFRDHALTQGMQEERNREQLKPGEFMLGRGMPSTATGAWIPVFGQGTLAALMWRQLLLLWRMKPVLELLLPLLILPVLYLQINVGFLATLLFIPLFIYILFPPSTFAPITGHLDVLNTLPSSQRQLAFGQLLVPCVVRVVICAVLLIVLLAMAILPLGLLCLLLALPPLFWTHLATKEVIFLKYPVQDIILTEPNAKERFDSSVAAMLGFLLLIFVYLIIALLAWTAWLLTESYALAGVAAALASLVSAGIATNLLVETIRNADRTGVAMSQP